MSLFDAFIRLTLPLIPKFIVGRVGRRYIAGDRLESAVAAVHRLNAEGALGTMDFLGEEVRTKDQAQAAAEEYMQILAAIEREGLQCNISIKPTHFGLKLDPGFCQSNIERVVERAAEMGNFVRLDMEDHATTDRTLELHSVLKQKFGNVGVVLQSMLRRTRGDVEQLAELPANIRLCKGIYREPRSVAWHGFDIVRQNYLSCLERLFSGGSYVGIATHDEYLVWGAMDLIQRLKLAPEQYEFQMLLGVEPELRKIILEAKHKVRVYVPYGNDWYGYSTRRLRENPSVAKHIMMAMFRREASV